MANYVTVTSDKSKSKVLKICAIGGLFGAHDYYLGKIGMGLLKTCTCNFASIGWIYDLIKISTGGYTDNSGQPIRK